LRIVEYFESRYAAFRGLNLTLGVREGIIKHSRDYSVAEHPELAAYMLDERPPLEAQIIDLVDEIAYLTADLDDGFEAEILPLQEIRANVRLFEEFYVRKRQKSWSSTRRSSGFSERWSMICWPRRGGGWSGKPPELSTLFAGHRDALPPFRLEWRNCAWRRSGICMTACTTRQP
jgi:hypothetical protein